MQRHIVMFAVMLAVAPAASAQPSVWDKLMARAQMESERARTRGIALNMACEWADPAGANQIVSLLSGWIEAADQPPGEAGGENDARRELIAAVVQYSGGRLNEMADPASTLAVWTAVATSSWPAQEIKETAFKRIADNPSWSGARQAAALTALAGSGVGHAGRLPAEFAPFIDDAAIPTLRAIVSQSGFDTGTFNFTAASILAEAGDTTILPDLQARQDGFHAIDPHYGEALAWYVWQIEVQNPPSRLLQHVASAELLSPQSRHWAVHRAIKLGLPADEIRQAILQYEATGHRVGPEHLTAGIATIKASATDAGILSADDLSGVPDVGAADDPSDFAPTICANWDVQTPAVSWEPPWEPRYENYDAFFEWSQSIAWESVSDDDALALLRQKLCELELIEPAQCSSEADVPPSQP
jgi:hypothetical protein